MFDGKGIPLFRLFGFSVRLDWSWLIIFVLLTWSLSAGTFPYFFPGLQATTYFWMGLVGALGLFFSIVLHELGHSLAARRHGVEMRGITLFIFGGVAEMSEEPPSPKAELAIAIAGPIVSVLISAVCLSTGWLGQAVNVHLSVRGVLLYLGWINLALVAFNMIPAFPLDGGRVLRAVLWGQKGDLKAATRITSAIGSGFGVVMILFGALNFIGGNFIGGMWWFLLGMFLRGAAQTSYQQLLVRRALEGEPVSRFMQSEVVTVPAGATIREFVDDYVFKYHHKMYPVTDNGSLQGYMSTRMVKQWPATDWAQHTVGEVASACSDENSISPDADALKALSKMSQHGLSRLIVRDNGQLVGVVTLKDLMRFISLKVELEPE
jgi:Zn-dependent protease/CBS domain-containing protein